MAATKKDIGNWLARGLEQGADRMLVVCDTFEYSDYPVYIATRDDLKAAMDSYGPDTMTRVMEVYDLTVPIEPQLNERRAWHT